MDTKRYAAFIAAAETRSMSGAAKRLGYTPSGIVRLVNALESELGFAVLVRTASGVAPTVEGEKLLPILREVLRYEEQAVQTSARIRGLSEGAISVGVNSPIASTWFPGMLRCYSERFPDIAVSVIEGDDARLRSLLESHQVDCCLMYGEHEGLEWVQLGSTELVAWLPAGSELRGQETVEVAQFDGLPFIRIRPETDGSFSHLFSKKGIYPDVRFEAAERYTAFLLVAAGMGCSLCCAGAAEAWEGDVQTRPLAPPRFIDYGVATVADVPTPPAVEEFVAFARDFANEG